MSRALVAMSSVIAAGCGLRWLGDWGATPDERAARLPGDELIPDPADVTTLAVDIDAPAEQVWRWLVQLGADRAGFYSYTWLENLVGLHIHNAGWIRPEWQHLEVGDRIRLTPTGWMGLADGVALPAVQVEPARRIVLRQTPPQTPWNSVWSFHLDRFERSLAAQS